MASSFGQESLLVQYIQTSHTSSWDKVRFATKPDTVDKIQFATKHLWTRPTLKLQEVFKQ